MSFSETELPRIFVCIPVHNRIQYTIKCLESVFAQTYKNIRIIICDDGSTDGTARHLEKSFPEVVLISGDGNLWWTGATNLCVREALKSASDRDYIYTLNNDTELFPDTLSQLLSTSQKHPGALIGTLNLFYNDPGRIENSAFIFHRLKGYTRYNKWGEGAGDSAGIVKVDGLAGKGVLIPKTVFDQIGLFNEKHLPHYHADLEFSFRAFSAGFSLYIDQRARLLSHQEASGLGAITSAPDLREFLRSFTNRKSTHHLPSLFNYVKLVHRRTYLFHFIKDLFLVNLGFVRRYIKYKISNKR